ncbi:uncharacterized protein LOC134040663 isoform X1 [Osmerus eperlanus]|uniref:uncharacterized protein LOC134040663 isoform X1 n=1 Tax=Osmerus eperlanus TaxID=29151 RepID=UPI002E0FBE6F
MGELVCTLISLCAVGLCVSLSTSIPVHPAKEGQNVSLPCNLTLRSDTAWYLLRSEELQLVLAGEKLSKIDNASGAIYNKDPERFKSVEDSSGLISIEIISLRESDLGYYFCASRSHDGSMVFGKGICLAFEGKFPVPIYTHEGAEHREPPPCWVLLACVAPASALLSGLAVWALCFQKGRSIYLCSGCLKGNTTLKEMGLHYASLKHTARPRPPTQGKLPLEGDVTYSTVVCRVNPST